MKPVCFNMSRYITMMVVMGLLGSLFFLVTAGFADDQGPPKKVMIVGDFSKNFPGNTLPYGWEPLDFKSISEKTTYNIVNDSNQTVVKAESKASSSGLIRYVTIDPNDYPIIQWRWKVTNTFKKGDVTKKEGDDYPARIYIAFAFDPQKAGLLEKTKYKTLKLFLGKNPPTTAINYIWASKAPHNTIVPSPYTEQSMMVVVQSGSAKANQWVTETRDIVADYKAAFSKNPPMISAIAIMTDSNDTGEAASGYYGDIVLRAREF